jgi:outer membrane cobalamin receptor
VIPSPCSRAFRAACASFCGALLVSLAVLGSAHAGTFAAGRTQASTAPGDSAAADSALTQRTAADTTTADSSLGAAARADTARADSSFAEAASADSAAADSSVARAVLADTAATGSLAQPAAAATAAGGKSLGMADTVTILPPVRVDADRLDPDDRPSATNVRMDRSQLARFQPSTTADALLSAPGLDVTRTGPWASRVALRGMSGERVLVLVDGVRLQSGRGHGAQTSLVPAEKLESVELQMGSNGAEYGSDALAGVVELNTHRELLGANRMTFRVAARAGGPGNDRAAIAGLRAYTPNFGAEVSAGLGGLGSLVTPSGPVPHSSYREEDYGARVRTKWGASLFDLEHTRHAARDIELPAFSDDAGSSGEFPLQSRDATRLEWKLPSSDQKAEAKLLGVHQRYRSDFVESVTDSQFLRGRFVGTKATRADDRVTTWSSSVLPSARYGATRVYGEYRQETTSGPRTTDVEVYNASGAQTSSQQTAGESVPPARRDVWAGGVRSAAQWSVLRLDGGARYDWLHSRADSTPQSFTPTLDVVDERWSVDAGLSASLGVFGPYLRAATGFRAPNLEERYFNNDIHGGLRLFGNPDLTAEYSRTGEVGLRVNRPGARFESARFTAYRSNVEDLITLRYIGQLYLVPRFQYTNVDRARLEGLEFEASGRTGPLRLTANAAFPRGYDLETGDRLTDIGAARVTLDTRVTAGAWLPTGMLALRVRWTDAAPNDQPELAQPSFWTAAIEASCVVRQTRVALTVRNLTNTQYREPMSFIDEPGRTLMCSVRREFEWPL